MAIPVTVTLKQARKRLAMAYASQEAGVHVRTRGSLGKKIYQLEAGAKTMKERAVWRARKLVETMVAHELDRLEYVVIQGDEFAEDGGWSTVYLAPRNRTDLPEVLFIIHSSADKVGLGDMRQRELDRFLAVRRATVI